MMLARRCAVVGASWCWGVRWASASVVVPKIARLERAVWRAHSAAHVARVERILGAAPEVAAKAKANPVTNFIFRYYYGFKPRDLSRWSPGVGVALEGAKAKDVADLARGAWVASEDGYVCEAPVLLKREPFVHAVETMRATERRAPVWNCFGLHEWAMVYQQDPAERHQEALPLRVDAAAIAAVVEEPGALRCTHLDAYRFFTPAAKPLNLHTTALQRERQAENEQPACVHATMDLFKYALRLGAFLPAEYLADALEIAFDARVVDMRASPYDCSSFDGYRGLDLSPIRVETAEGRKRYTFLQAELASRAAPIRRELIRAYDDLLSNQLEPTKAAAAAASGSCDDGPLSGKTPPLRRTTRTTKANDDAPPPGGRPIITQVLGSASSILQPLGHSRASSPLESDNSSSLRD